MNSRVLGTLAALCAAAIWGGMYVVSKLVLDVIPPMTFVVIRFCVALPVLMVWYRLSGGRWLPRRQALGLALTSLVGFCFSLGAQFGGTRLGSASNAALITSATPAFIIPFAYLLLRERPTRWKLIGLALATAGMIVVVNPTGMSAGGSSPLLGNLLLVIAALTWALYSVMVKRTTNEGVSALAVTLYVTAWGICWDVPLAALELRGMAIGTITPPVIAGVLYVGIVSTAIAFYLWNKGFELLDANTAALCFFAQPVVGALLGALLLGETLGAGFFAGGALILAGALVSQRNAAVNDYNSTHNHDQTRADLNN